MRSGNIRRAFAAGCALSALAMLGGCGGGGVASTPVPQNVPPPPTPPPPPPPPPPPTSSFDTAEYRASNGAAQAGAIAAYNAGATGTGVIAAVIDSGIAQGSPEFTGRISPSSADLAGSRGIGDEGGHGTAVSELLLGAKNDSIVHGVAFNATLLVARTDTPGSCANTAPDQGCSHNDNNIARGLDLAVAANARVINISLGGSPPNATLRAALGRATAAGVIVVFSAGNDSSADPDPLAQFANDPAARNLILIAGGLDASNTALTSFSNRAGNGASHYISALASRLLSIDETGTTLRFTGTSFSAPIVSGAVALLAQAFPNLSGAQIVDLLLNSATDLGAAGTDPEFGRGALNLARAFAPQGSAALAGSAITVDFGTLGTASTAMGDGGQTGSSAVILDSYGRAYDMELGGRFSAAQPSTRLAQALEGRSHSLAAASDHTAFSLSLLPGQDDASIERLLLSGQDRARARALAGSIVTRLGPQTSLALGISTSGIGLARDLEGGRTPAFLAGRAADSAFGFDAKAGSGLALAQRAGGFTLSLAAEQGTARIWQNDPRDGLRPGWRGYRYGSASVGAARTFGALRLDLHGTLLSERDTILGGRLGTLFSSNGASSLFADTGAQWQAGRRLTLAAALRQGWTRVSGGSLHASADWLKSSAWSFDASRSALLDPEDVLAFRVAQPLRISSGSLGLTLPVSYDYATRSTGYGAGALNLAPSGREVDVEALYGRGIGAGRVTGNIYWRRDPGNIASAPDDLGLAIRFTLGM